MKFTIFSHVDHCLSKDQYYAYAPYVREMNLWIKNFDSVEIVAHISKKEISNIDLAYSHQSLFFNSIKAFDLTSLKNIFFSLIYIPGIIMTIAKAMHRADHIHLRCPGNIGLLACLVQIFFPNKPKTAKYAGNWDPSAKQPWSYRLQKWILNNTFLTRNMQVLVYGNWEGISKNIKPFFTATYTSKEAKQSMLLQGKTIDLVNTIKFIFVGTLSVGKRPLYTLQLWHQLSKQHPNLKLEFYGEGAMRGDLEKYIMQYNLHDKVMLNGNQPKEVIEKAYQQSNFLILASNSEGWPKVVAEAMFWGCVPLSTNVSCVYEMMGFGTRGLLLEVDLDKDMKRVLEIINSEDIYIKMSNQSKVWSTAYTLDTLEKEIAILLKK